MGGEFGGGRGRMRGGGERGFAHRGVAEGLIVSGDVTSISGNNIIINDGNTDTHIAVSSSTSYIKQRKVAKQSDLATGNNVSVRGTSDSSGVVSATSIIIR